jgi:hypothetical protein
MSPPGEEEWIVPDNDQSEAVNTQITPIRANLEEIFEQGQVEAHKQLMEESAALARAHYEVEPGLQAIYRIEGPDPNGVRIKLLEINSQTFESGIVPVGFPAHPASGLHFPSVVIEVTPQEYEKIRREEMRLPSGWVVRGEYSRPSAEDHVEKSR